MPQSDVEVDPEVSAFIGRANAATPTIVVTSGSVRVRAELTRAGAAVPNDSITSVDLSEETLTFHKDGSFPEIGTGDTVMYSATTGQGGLKNGGRLHRARRQLYPDPARCALRHRQRRPVDRDDHLRRREPVSSGDCVYYDPRGGTSILASWQTAQAGGTCTNTTTDTSDRVFFVQIVDNNTIKLRTTVPTPPAPLIPGFPPTPTDDAPFDFTVHDSDRARVQPAPRAGSP